MTISLCMIVKNEEAVLARCLTSAKTAVDEIIIVDTGSTDATKTVAAQFTDRIYDFGWVDDFSAARNFSYSLATMEYQMWLDADDVLPEGSAVKLRELKETVDPAADLITMKYITQFDEHGNAVFSTTRERLTRTSKKYLWQDPVHECIPLTGHVFHSGIEVHHKRIEKNERKERNLNIYTALEQSGRPLSPRQQYYFARELKDHSQWAKAAYYFERFLDSGKGWHEDNIAACFNLSLCYHALGTHYKIMPILTKSFEYDTPRAEICTQIGYYYKRIQNFATALKWFRLAARLDPPDSIGFILHDYWGYIPYIEACVCAYQLGDRESAIQYNEQAAVYKPQDKTVEYNRRALQAI